MIIFISGIIWERLDASYGASRAKEQWDILRRTFVFGLAAYLATFCIWWAASFYFKGLNFHIFKFEKDVEFLDGPGVRRNDH